MNLTTERLVFRPFTVADAEFAFELVNSKPFRQFIGDKQVRTHNDAVRYLETGPIASYREYGFGMCAVLMDGEPVGMCGLLKRPSMDDVEIGYAFLPEVFGKGIGTEAVRAALSHAWQSTDLMRIAALLALGNTASRALLLKAGFCEKGEITLPDFDHPNLLMTVERPESSRQQHAPD